MTPIERPYTKNPSELARRQPWFDKFESIISSAITDSYKIISDEAQLDRIPELADESFLYECFTKNVEFNMVQGNWQVLKYFNANMQVKILKDMIGQWEFTAEDKEMYNHFLTMKVTDENHCTSPKLHFKSNELPWLDGSYLHKDMQFIPLDYHIMFDGKDVVYPELFHQEFTSLYAMVRNAKKLILGDVFYHRPLFTYKNIYIDGWDLGKFYPEDNEWRFSHNR